MALNPKYNKDGSFQDEALESLYQEKPYSKDWHFHKFLPLKGKLTRKEFVERLRLGVSLGFI